MKRYVFGFIHDRFVLSAHTLYTLIHVLGLNHFIWVCEPQCVIVCVFMWSIDRRSVSGRTRILRSEWRLMPSRRRRQPFPQYIHINPYTHHENANHHRIASHAVAWPPNMGSTVEPRESAVRRHRMRSVFGQQSNNRSLPIFATHISNRYRNK